MDAAGVAWTAVAGLKLAVFSASAVTASPALDGGAAGFGAGGLAGSLATVIGPVCKGSAAPAAGRTGLMSTSNVADPSGATAGFVAGFAAGAAATCTV